MCFVINAAKIGLFYLCFYSSLALFFAIMLAGFFSTVDNRAPTQQGMLTPLKLNPGIARHSYHSWVKAYLFSAM